MIPIDYTHSWKYHCATVACKHTHQVIVGGPCFDACQTLHCLCWWTLLRCWKQFCAITSRKWNLLSCNQSCWPCTIIHACYSRAKNNEAILTLQTLCATDCIVSKCVCAYIMVSLLLNLFLMCFGKKTEHLVSISEELVRQQECVDKSLLMMCWWRQKEGKHVWHWVTLIVNCRWTTLKREGNLLHWQLK